LEQSVQGAVNSADPIHLLRDGAPDNEYDMEVELILGALIRLGPNQPELSRVIRQIFDKKFWSGAVSAAWAEQIAHRICDDWAAIVDEE
jgi:hypothetical protein